MLGKNFSWRCKILSYPVYFFSIDLCLRGFWLLFCERATLQPVSLPFLPSGVSTCPSHPWVMFDVPICAIQRGNFWSATSVLACFLYFALTHVSFKSFFLLKQTPLKISWNLNHSFTNSTQKHNECSVYIRIPAEGGIQTKEYVT